MKQIDSQNFCPENEEKYEEKGNVLRREALAAALPANKSFLPRTADGARRTVERSPIPFSEIRSSDFDLRRINITPITVPIHFRANRISVQF